MSDIFPHGSTARSVNMASAVIGMRNMPPRWQEMRFGETYPEAEARWAKDEAERPAREAAECAARKARQRVVRIAVGLATIAGIIGTLVWFFW